jgi:hypothetical protein
LLHSVCLNARSKLNKINKLLKLISEEENPYIIGVTVTWVNKQITEAEIGVGGYVMFRKDRESRLCSRLKELFRHVR